MLSHNLSEVLAWNRDLVAGGTTNDDLVGIEIVTVDLDSQHIAGIQPECRALTHATDCARPTAGSPRCAEYAPTPTMTDYPVIYEQANDGSWSVRAVDLPVFSVGDTREEAAESIREAFAFFLEGVDPPVSTSEVGTISV